MPGSELYAKNQRTGLLAWLLPAVPLTTVAVSALSYRFIEKPGMALGKRLSR